jgi:hypothetical protein
MDNFRRESSAMNPILRRESAPATVFTDMERNVRIWLGGYPKQIWSIVIIWRRRITCYFCGISEVLK